MCRENSSEALEHARIRSSPSAWRTQSHPCFPSFPLPPPPFTPLRSSNTNYWSPDDFYLYATEFQPDDPEGILGFLMQELQKAETSGQRAIIIGHASPSMAMPEQSHFFDQIIQRYRATVVAQFYGHTHSSDFVLGYATPASKSPETASSVSFIAGALTPLGGMVNPGFRVYDLDEATGEVWDWKEYYTNISDPTFNDGPVWQQLYTARQAYGPLVPGSEGEPLGPAFWHRLTQVLESSEQAFRTFIFNKFRGSRFGQRKACRTDKCRAYAICGLRRGRSEERCSAIRLSNELDSTPPSAPRPTTHIPSSSDPGDDGGDGRTDTDDDAQTDHGISTELSAEDMEALDANEMSRQGGGHTNIHNFGLKELLLGIHDRTASDAAEVSGSAGQSSPMVYSHSCAVSPSDATRHTSITSSVKADLVTMHCDSSLANSCSGAAAQDETLSKGQAARHAHGSSIDLNLRPWGFTLTIGQKGIAAARLESAPAHHQQTLSSSSILPSSEIPGPLR